MKIITLIRHGESLANIGVDMSLNPHLSDHGYVQSARLKGDYDLAIISPLVRARETFQNSQIQARRIVYCDLFVEKTSHESDFLYRIDQALSYILAQPEKNIVVITHGTFMVYFLNRVGILDGLRNIYNAEEISFTLN